MTRRVRLLLALSLVLAACAGGGSGLPDDAFALVVSSDLAIGPQRVAVAIIAQDNTSLVTPDLDAEIEFIRPDSTPAATVPADFIWAIEDVRGLLVTQFAFDEAGLWRLAIRTTEGDLVSAGPFQVFEAPLSIGMGQPAPASVTKTAGDGDLHTVSSDPDPDPRFYEMTIAEAVASGSPSVVVFATPAFCVSATCGPSLDVAKVVADDHDDVNWIHVEVFDNHLEATSREELVVADAVLDWGLQTEPWVYVIGGDGVVTARFEGAVGEAELRAAVEAVSP